MSQVKSNQTEVRFAQEPLLTLETKNLLASLGWRAYDDRSFVHPNFWRLNVDVICWMSRTEIWAANEWAFSNYPQGHDDLREAMSRAGAWPPVRYPREHYGTWNSPKDDHGRTRVRSVEVQVPGHLNIDPKRFAALLEKHRGRDQYREAMRCFAEFLGDLVWCINEAHQAALYAGLECLGGRYKDSPVVQAERSRIIREKLAEIERKRNAIIGWDPYYGADD